VDFDIGFNTNAATKSVKLYTDGASRGNVVGESICAYAFYGEYNGYETLGGKAFVGYTNNQMELTGLIIGLRNITNKNLPVEVYLDSKYVFDSITKNWMKSWKRNGWTKDGGLKNDKYWMALDVELNKFKKIHFNWTKGHANNFGNNIADKKCNDLMDNFEEEELG